MEAARNVVLFGECGVGKSSIINAIVGQPVAKTSNDVLGCTEETVSYPVTLDSGIRVNLWDTIGLDEGTLGRVPAGLAKQRLKSFLQKQLVSSGGVDLLLYCVRGAASAKPLPVKQGHWDNYKFVFEEVCKKRVPIAMIITYLESYDPSGDMDSWWEHNKQKILKFGFQFCSHACITTLPPEPGVDVGDVSRIEVSKRRLEDLLSRNFLAPRNVLLFGDREDREDFIDMTISSHNKQNFDHRENVSSSFTCVPVSFDGHTHVNFWNTSVFEETNDDALVTDKILKLLIRGIRQTAGIDLLVLCFRAGRPKIRHTRNYNLFYAAICRKKVPVAVVVLGSEDRADTWWQRNEQDLRQKGFIFDRHVYIPCDPLRPRGPSGDLDDTARRQLLELVQEEYTSGSWHIGDHPFWVTLPNVRAVIGELSWPTTTVVVCDMTRQDAFVYVAPDVQSSLRGAQREYRFQQIDPQSLPSVTSQSAGAGSIQPRMADQANKGIGLIMFFIRAEEPDDQTWRTLERFYSTYDGRITPFIVVVYGAPQRKLAEDFWRAAPSHIRRRI